VSTVVYSFYSVTIKCDDVRRYAIDININSQLDATIIILLITSISSACFGR